MQFIIYDLYLVINKKLFEDKRVKTNHLPLWLCYTSVLEAMRDCGKDEIVIQVRDLFKR